MKFKKIKRFLTTDQDVIELNVEHINTPNEIVYFRNSEIYKLVYSKTKYDNYQVNSIFGFNTDGYNGISIRLIYLEEDK